MGWKANDRPVIPADGFARCHSSGATEAGPADRTSSARAVAVCHQLGYLGGILDRRAERIRIMVDEQVAVGISPADNVVHAAARAVFAVRGVPQTHPIDIARQDVEDGPDAIRTEVSKRAPDADEIDPKFRWEVRTENDDLAWPHRDGLIWPHFSSVVVGLDVA